MFSNLQIRTTKPQHRKSSMITRAGIAKRRVSLVPASAANNVPALSFMEDLFGDEFPEAFASGHVHMGKRKKSFLDLPTELLNVICNYLSKLDIKRLRLANKQMALNVDLRLDRVYISPNQANLNCLQRVLEHSRYRNCVKEVVWDDAQLEQYQTLDSFRHAVEIDERRTMRDAERRLDQAMQDYPDDNPEYHSLDDDDFFSDDGKLTDVAKGILLEHNDHFSRDIIARNAAVMSIEASYLLYQRLYKEEQDLIKHQVDSQALHRALRDFPNLRRITLTSEVWRPWNLYPEYDTPFYRSLPPGFRKPSVWPWLGPRPQATPAQETHRDEIMSAQRIDWLPKEWRGYGIIVSALLHLPDPRIEDFIIDVGNEFTGLGHQLFCSPNPELERTIRMLRVVPLKRFQIALNPYRANNSNIESFLSSGLVERTLREMQHLVHLDINLNQSHRSFHASTTLPIYAVDMDKILPESLIRKLRSFKLRNVRIREASLLEAIAAMDKVEQVTLDTIGLVGRVDLGDDIPSWSHFFHQLKLHYSLASHVLSRPTITWKALCESRQESGHRTFVIDEDDMNAFLYADRDSPFCSQTGDLNRNMTWVIDDRDKAFRVRLADMWSDTTSHRYL